MKAGWLELEATPFASSGPLPGSADRKKSSATCHPRRKASSTARSPRLGAGSSGLLDEPLAMGVPAEPSGLRAVSKSITSQFLLARATTDCSTAATAKIPHCDSIAAVRDHGSRRSLNECHV